MISSVFITLPLVGCDDSGHFLLLASRENTDSLAHFRHVSFTPTCVYIWRTVNAISTSGWSGHTIITH